MRIRNGTVECVSPTLRRPTVWEGRRMAKRCCLAVFLSLFLTIPAWPQQKPADLTERSLKDLMNIEVTSVSKKQEKLAHTAAAIFVITAEDIRRSGATNIPDLLRMVPGLDVAQVNGSSWAVSSRGFNDQVADKLLVLIDGRTVYSPLFNGVFWDVQEVPLENIERIEVIRGPGAAIWGANAVNGVINIISKTASETQGALITGGGGTHDRGFGMAQYGGTLGGETTYRVDSENASLNHLTNLAGQNGDDGWDVYRAGFRVDSKLGAKDSLTIQGDGYTGSEGEVVAAVTSLVLPQPQVLDLRQNIGGWDILSRWDRAFSPTSQTTLQVYFDRTNRGDATYGEGRDTFDIDFQHHITWGKRQDIVWGLGFRSTSDSIRGSFRVFFTPSAVTDLLFSSFVQDEIAIRPGSLYLTLGTRLDHNPDTGFGVEPSASLAWLANDKTTFWTSISRALGTPSRKQDVRFNEAILPDPGGPPILESVFGFKQKDEAILATEIGYRTQISEHLSLDLTGFYNSYTNIESSAVGALFVEADPAPMHLVLPIFLANMLHGEGYGAEVVANWKPISRWTLSPGFSYLQLHLHHDPTSTDTTTAAAAEGSSPREQAQLRSHVEMTSRWAWDTSVYFVGRLPALQIPSYTRLDAGLTWRLRERLSFSVAGQNLLQGHHVEFSSSSQIVLSSLVKRSVYAKIVWRF
jgi:iron complex outermembrane receptor protein